MDVHIDGGGGIDPGQLLDGKHRHEDGSAAAAVLLRNFDPHEPELEKLGNQVQAELRRLVHLMDVGPDFGGGEFPDRVAEHRLFLGQHGESGSGAGGIGHLVSYSS